MQETEPALNGYMGQDYHSHTTGTYAHRPERDEASPYFPGAALKASQNVERPEPKRETDLV